MRKFFIASKRGKKERDVVMEEVNGYYGK